MALRPHAALVALTLLLSGAGCATTAPVATPTEVNTNAAVPAAPTTGGGTLITKTFTLVYPEDVTLSEQIEGRAVLTGTAFTVTIDWDASVNILDFHDKFDPLTQGMLGGVTVDTGMGKKDFSVGYLNQESAPTVQITIDADTLSGRDAAKAFLNTIDWK